MEQIISKKINRFDSGIVNDSRDTQENVCRMVSNFDIQNPRKLTPYRDSESGDTNASTDKIENIVIAPATDGISYQLYGLGVVLGQAYVKLFTKNSFGDGSWTDAVNGADTSLTRNNNLLVHYKKVGAQGTIYGATGSRYIWSYAIATNTYTQGAYDTGASGFTNLSNGLVHSKDDIMYFGADNLLIKNNNGSFATALTLPTYYKINSICEYGNALAIGVSNLSGLNSRVFLWDRDSTLTTLQETIDWGSGILKVLEEIDGKLIGISLDSYYDGTTQLVIRQNDVITFRYLSDATAITFKKLTGTTATQLPIAKQKINSKLHFMMSIVIDGVRREGVWSIGRALEGSPFALVHERTPNNDTALAGGDLKNFFYAGDYLFISSTTTSSTATYQLTKTNDGNIHTATSIYETVKYSVGDIALTKKLLSATVTFEFLPTGATIVLKYRKDEEANTILAGSFVTGTSYTIASVGNTDFTLIGASANTIGISFTATGAGSGTGTAIISWKQIFSYATASALRHTAINIESSGAALPQFKEIQFRIESTNATSGQEGAEITSLHFKSEIIPDDILN